MKDLSKVRKGMQVYNAENKVIGDIQDVLDNEVVVNNQRIPVSWLDRTDKNRVYLTREYTDRYGQQTQDELRVPIAEERLNVQKQQVNTGEAQVHKRVTAEQQSVPVELRHEEINVETRRIDPERPLQPGEVEGAFQEGTLRVPLRGEEATANKQAFVTGEAVIKKNVVGEQREVSDQVRREEVYVDDTNANNYQAGQVRRQDTTSRDYSTTSRDYDTDTGAYGTDTSGYATDPYQQSGAGSYTKATGDYATTGYTGSQSGNWDLHEGMEVVASDGDKVGKVKSVQGDTFVVDRKMKKDIAVTFNSIDDIQGDQIMLNMPSQALDTLP